MLYLAFFKDFPKINLHLCLFDRLMFFKYLKIHKKIIIGENASYSLGLGCFPLNKSKVRIRWLIKDKTEHGQVLEWKRIARDSQEELYSSPPLCGWRPDLSASAQTLTWVPWWDYEFFKFSKLQREKQEVVILVILQLLLLHVLVLLTSTST